MLKRKFTRNEAYDMKYYENINKLMWGGGKSPFLIVKRLIWVLPIKKVVA